MRVLALDTTTQPGSVALVDDTRTIIARCGDASRPHAQRLPGELTALLGAGGAAVGDVDLFAIASGPGSFTGLRIGIATIQGLALVTARRVAAISALDALAHIASAGHADGSIVASWMDARRGEVFSALYRVAPGAAFALDRLVEIESPAVGDPTATLARWAEHHGATPAVFAGDGALLYADLIRTRADGAAISAPPMLAPAIGRLAVARHACGDVVDASGIRPLYVRRPDAEIARDASRHS